MEYEQEFHIDFMQRTLKVLQEYDGEYDATLLLNALLGLLIVPKESSFELIPPDPLEMLTSWGIKPDSIKKFGKCRCGAKHPETLRQLVKSLRNSVVHFRFTPIHKNRRCTGFEFDDRSGFKAEISLCEIRNLTAKLAKHLEQKLSV